MSNIPEDVIINILLRLPVKSIIRFRCVSKQWIKLFSDHTFIKLHFDIASENEKGLELYGKQNIYLLRSYRSILRECPLSSYYENFIVGSCNGLLCIANIEKTICIWNPCTKMLKAIPSEAANYHRYYGSRDGIKLGFGYDPHNEEYKCVRFWVNSGNGSIAEVYTEGSNTWKPEQVIPYSFDEGNVFGVFVNENLHWIANHCSGSETRRLILSFSIRDESFGELPLPENVIVYRDVVGVMGGDLCIIDSHHCAGLDVWVRKDYGVNGSWNKLLVIPTRTAWQYASPSWYRMKMLHSFKNGEILLKLNNYTLLLYHPKYKESRIVTIQYPETNDDKVTFVGSLFPVNSGYFLERKRIEEVVTEPRKKPENKINNFLRGLPSIFKCFSG